jgi:hypothetical protein
MRFLNLIMGLVLAQGFLWPADQARAISLDTTEQSAKTTAWRIQANPQAIFSNRRGLPLSKSELLVSVREVLIADKSALQPVIAALALADTAEKAAIGTGLGQAMLAVVSSDPSYTIDILYALAAKADRTVMAAFVAVAGELVREPASQDANAGSAGAGDRSIGPGFGLGDNAASGSVGMAVSALAIAQGTPITRALPSAQADTKPRAPEGARTGSLCSGCQTYY